MRRYGYGAGFDVLTLSGYGGYGQDLGPTREEVIAATAAAEAAAREAEMQTELAKQERSFTHTLVVGFIGAAAASVVMWGIGQAVAGGKR